MRFTKPLLDKLQDLLMGLGYQVRYEKGSFKGGFCILEARKVVVVNKFFGLESRIGTLIDVLQHIPVIQENLAPDQQVLFSELKGLQHRREITS